MDINPRSPQQPNQPLLSGNYFKIYHQNIRSLRGKYQELLSHVFPNLPHVLCLTQHHQKAFELQNINMDHYTVGAHYCRTNHAKGGVVIYIHSSLQSTAINLGKYCMEKDVEICAVKLEIQTSVFCIIAVYRSPSGNFNRFLETIDAVLQSL